MRLVNLMTMAKYSGYPNGSLIDLYHARKYERNMHTRYMFIVVGRSGPFRLDCVIRRLCRDKTAACWTCVSLAMSASTITIRSKSSHSLYQDYRVGNYIVRQNFDRFPWFRTVRALSLGRNSLS